MLMMIDDAGLVPLGDITPEGAKQEDKHTLHGDTATTRYACMLALPVTGHRSLICALSARLSALRATHLVLVDNRFRRAHGRSGCHITIL